MKTNHSSYRIVAEAYADAIDRSVYAERFGTTYNRHWGEALAYGEILHSMLETSEGWHAVICDWFATTDHAESTILSVLDTASSIAESQGIPELVHAEEGSPEYGNSQQLWYRETRADLVRRARDAIARTTTTVRK